MTETNTPTKSETNPAPKENTAVDPERQKSVTTDYRNNWNRIFNTK